MSLSAVKLRQTVDEGTTRMRARRRAEQQLAEAAREYPEVAAREILVFARTEQDRLRRQLSERFGFSVSREPSGFRCRFASPERRPKTPEKAAIWIDAVVALAGFEMALDQMWLAAVYFPPPDRARMICNAFYDVMRETPAVYAAFAACQEEYAPGVREYASAMLAAWARSHLKVYPGTKAALEGTGWETELVSAALLAWQELGPYSPIKRGTRFRDTLPKQKDGLRQRAPGPPDFINRVDRLFTGRDSGQQAKPLELELARFADREAVLRIARDAGLPPRELEIYRLFIDNPGIKNREVAERLDVSVGTVKQLKSRIKRSLGAAGAGNP